MGDLVFVVVEWWRLFIYIDVEYIAIDKDNRATKENKIYRRKEIEKLHYRM